MARDSWITCLRLSCSRHDDDDGRGREEVMKLSIVTRKYRGRDLDLACLAAVALVSLSLWPRGPGRQGKV